MNSLPSSPTVHPTALSRLSSKVSEAPCSKGLPQQGGDKVCFIPLMWVVKGKRVSV